MILDAVLVSSQYSLTFTLPLTRTHKTYKYQNVKILEPFHLRK